VESVTGPSADPRTSTRRSYRCGSSGSHRRASAHGVAKSTGVSAPAVTVTGVTACHTRFGPSHTECVTDTVAAAPDALRSTVVPDRVPCRTEVRTTVSAACTGASPSSHTSCQIPAHVCPHHEPHGWW
jgi:hypothetical protein